MENKQKGNPLFLIGISVLTLAVYLFFFFGAEHIEDVNGPDDFSLATLTDADILADSFECVGGPNRNTGRISLPGGWTISDGVELWSDEFSGVADILWADYILPSDFSLDLDSFTVEGGNFRMVVINNGEIIAEIQPGENVQCLIEGLTGYTVVRIAGESAAFSITMTELNYDLFQHAD